MLVKTAILAVNRGVLEILRHLVERNLDSVLPIDIGNFHVALIGVRAFLNVDFVLLTLAANFNKVGKSIEHRQCVLDCDTAHSEERRDHDRNEDTRDDADYAQSQPRSDSGRETRKWIGHRLKIT